MATIIPITTDVSSTELTINTVLRYLRTNSTVFNSYFDNLSIKEIFNNFVNIDAFKDNKHVFKRGSNFYFTAYHGDTLGENVKQFKGTIRNVMDDLKKVNITHFLYVHKLKYKSNGSLPRPDIAKYLNLQIPVDACYDSGYDPTAIFGVNANPIRYNKLCSVANTKIDPGPSGNCSSSKHIESSYNPITLSKEFFNLFGYKNIESFNDTGNNSFELKLKLEGKARVQSITHKKSDEKYLEGNAKNRLEFINTTTNKSDLDIRTTMKKLGDDLQVFLTYLYKTKISERNNNQVIMMLTCDLGVVFTSIMLGLDCVFQGDNSQEEYKISNTIYIKSTINAREPDFDAEFNKTKDEIVSEYNDFLSIIDNIIRRILDPSSDIEIQVRTTVKYIRSQLNNPNTINFFRRMMSEIIDICDYINGLTYDSLGTLGISQIENLKKMYPNKFIVKNKYNNDKYLFTLETRYTKGKVPNSLQVGETKLKKTFSIQFASLLNDSIPPNLRGGKPLKTYNEDTKTKELVNEYFITDNNMSFYAENNDETINDDKNIFISVIYKNFQKAIREKDNYRRIINYYEVPYLFCSCLSYVDDLLNGCPNYDNIHSYIKIFCNIAEKCYNYEITHKNIITIYYIPNNYIYPHVMRKRVDFIINETRKNVSSKKSKTSKNKFPHKASHTNKIGTKTTIRNYGY